ncbi:hypothetical protein GA0070613_6224 [Micromonospora inositola]|uniref:Uncharacterized protein n=1 Tax=Micromonospora inositola TaxID=47865 RepID=A0A1C5K3H7_9ACTN|nr:hypothetical protein GA0070613_6224 [Micromonospora inositola]
MEHRAKYGELFALAEEVTEQKPLVSALRMRSGTIW